MKELLPETPEIIYTLDPTTSSFVSVEGKPLPPNLRVLVDYLTQLILNNVEPITKGYLKIPVSVFESGGVDILISDHLVVLADPGKRMKTQILLRK